MLDVLSRVDGEVLVPSPLQRRHDLCILRISLQRLGDTIPFDELLDRHRSSVEALDGVLETVEYGVRRSSRVEPVETVPLDVLADHYRLQMLAYALALFQHDPARQVRASLRFTDVDVEERFEWRRSELTDIESELRSMLELVS